MERKGEQSLSELARDPHTRFLVPLIVFNNLYRETGWKDFEKYASLRQNYSADIIQEPILTPSVLNSVARLYLEQKSTKDIINTLNLPPKSLEKARGLILSTILFLVKITNNESEFVNNLQKVDNLKSEDFFNTRNINKFSIPPSTEKTIQGIIAIPELISTTPKIWTLAQHNPHMTSFFEYLASGYNVRYLLRDTDKIDSRIGKYANWLKYFARGEISSTNWQPLPDICENLILSLFLKECAWLQRDFNSHMQENESDNENNWSVQENLASFSYYLFQDKGDELKRKFSIFSGGKPLKERLHYAVCLRSFYRFAFLISIEANLGKSIYSDFFSPNFSTKGYLRNYEKTDHDSIISSYFIDYYKHEGQLPCGFNVLLFNKPDAQHPLIQQWSTKFNGIPWSRKYIQSMQNAARRLVVNMMIEPTDRNWRKITRNRNAEIRQIEKLLFAELQKKFHTNE